MNKEEAKKTIEKSVEKYGIPTKVTDEYLEGWNDGVLFMRTMVERYVEGLHGLLNDPPQVK